MRLILLLLLSFWSAVSSRSLCTISLSARSQNDRDRASNDGNSGILASVSIDSEESREIARLRNQIKELEQRVGEAEAELLNRDASLLKCFNTINAYRTLESNGALVDQQIAAISVLIRDQLSEHVFTTSVDATNDPMWDFPSLAEYSNERFIDDLETRCGGTGKCLLVSLLRSVLNIPDPVPMEVTESASSSSASAVNTETEQQKATRTRSLG